MEAKDCQMPLMAGDRVPFYGSCPDDPPLGERVEPGREPILGGNSPSHLYVTTSTRARKAPRNAYKTIPPSSAFWH